MIRLTYVIYNHELQAFQDCISSCGLCYVVIYNLAYIPCIMHKGIYYFAICETSDVMMSITYIEIIFSNQIGHMVFN